jgi:two-component system catabolic regulation response regulator CreB
LFSLDHPGQRIEFCGTPLALSRYEFNLFAVLIDHPGRVFSREQLMNMAWEEPRASMDRTVDAHIKNIRAKLKTIRPDLDPIITHRGIGYALRE